MRTARRRRHLSYARLAARLEERGAKASRGYLSEIEKGVRSPRDLNLAIALESVLGVPVESWPAFELLPRLLEMRGSDGKAA